MWGFKRKLTGLERREKGRELAMRMDTHGYTEYQVEWALMCFQYTEDGMFGTFEDVTSWAWEEGHISYEMFDRIVRTRAAAPKMGLDNHD